MTPITKTPRFIIIDIRKIDCTVCTQCRLQCTTLMLPFRQHTSHQRADRKLTLHNGEPSRLEDLRRIENHPLLMRHLRDRLLLPYKPTTRAPVRLVTTRIGCRMEEGNCVFGMVLKRCFFNRWGKGLCIFEMYISSGSTRQPLYYRE